MSRAPILRRRSRAPAGLDEAIAAMIRRGCKVAEITGALRCGCHRVAAVRSTIGVPPMRRGGRRSFVERVPAKAARAFQALRDGASYKDAAALAGELACTVQRAWMRAVAEGRELPMRRRRAKVTGPERTAIAAALATGRSAAAVAADLGIGVTAVRTVKARAGGGRCKSASGSAMAPAIRFEDDPRAARADRGGQRLGARATGSGWGGASSIAGLG